MFRNLFGITAFTCIAVWLGASLVAAYYVFNHNSQIYAENGTIENVQALVLALACAVFLAVAVFDKNAKRLIILTLSLLCYSFVLRELDVEKLDVPAAIQFMGSGIGRNASIGAAFAAIFLYAGLTNFTFYKKSAVEFMKAKPGVLLLIAVVFLFVGQFFEEQTGIAFNVFFEEAFELLGYIFILLSSLSVVSFMNKGESLADKGVAV